MRRARSALPLDVVDHFAGVGVHEERVDGEVAAEYVLAGVGFVGTRLRGGGRRVGVVAAEGGDLDGEPVAA